jgi:two-component system, OmpR family, sensor histidine kinase BaeS
VLANAIKYTPDGGTVSVSLSTSGGRVVLAIADTGVGIPESELPRLFDRFYRGTAAVEIGAPGTGLGLAIVKGLVELNGGTVAVSSTAGTGSVFTIELPVAAPHRP